MDADLQPDRIGVETDLGARIRERREILGITLTQLAEAMGFEAVELEHVEAGGEIFAADIFRLSRLLQVDIDYFFDDAHRPAEHSGDAQRLAQAYRGIGEGELRESVLGLTKKIADDG